MHQADDEGASGETLTRVMSMTMFMFMCVPVFLAMRVGMKMRRPAVVRVHVEMHSVAQKSPQDVRSESDQHDANGKLEPPRDRLGYDRIRQENDRADDEKRKRVTQTPNGTNANSLDPGCRARRQAGDRRDVIRLDRVTHAE